MIKIESNGEIMKKHIPLGFTQQQWQAITDDFQENSSTINDYRKVLNLLQNYKDGQYQILHLTKEQAKEYFDYLDAKEQNGTLSKNTVHRYKATLRSLGARMERHQDVFPGFANPFARLVKNEKRTRTEFTPEMFAKASDIQRLRDILPSLSNDEALIVSLLIDVGLSPHQIEQIRVCDFYQEGNTLFLNVPPTTFIERKADGLNLSVETAPISLVKESGNGNKTWKCIPTFEFFQPTEASFKEKIPTLGANTDTRHYFMTARHMSYSYRAIHHLITSILQKAGLKHTDITPYQLSLYGMVRSYLLDTNLRKHATLDQQLTLARDIASRNAITEQIKQVEEIFLPLAKKSWVGNWKGNYPISMYIQIQAIKNQLGEDFLLKVVGL